MHDIDKLKQLFVSCAVAQQMDHLQFNDPCFGFYTTFDSELTLSKPIRNTEILTNAVTAPTYQQVIDWLRENEGLIISQDNGYLHGYRFTYSLNNSRPVYLYSDPYYYKALAGALDQALLILKKQNDDTKK